MLNLSFMVVHFILLLVIVLYLDCFFFFFVCLVINCRAKTSKMGIYNPNPSTPYHQSWWGTKPRATHVSYNPTSAQDSDLASLSEASVSTDCLRR